jgi:predicted ATPase/DNA-binding SARP family transcriptional activator
MGEATLEFGILGPLEVRVNGEALPLGPPKQRALLMRLLLSANELVAAERLVEELWDGEAPAQAAHAVQVYVSALRKTFGAHGAAARLETRRPGYILHVGPSELDADRFVTRLEEGRGALRRSHSAAASALLGEALAVWRGPALADFRYEGFAQAEADRLEELRLACLEERIEANLAGGAGSDLVGDLETLVAEHPRRERFRGQLMIALYRAGRQADALDCYQQGRERLVDELGIDPSPELQALQRAILNQDAALAAAPAPDRARTNLPEAPTQLVGRKGELAQLHALLGRSDVRLVTLTGPGGTGKTRLALQVASEASDAFPAGVFWVALASIHDPALVLSAVSQAVGVVEEPGVELVDRLVERLAGKRMLVLVDNAEHLLPDVAGTLARLRAADGPTLLVTSRERLQLQGEQVYAVRSLADADGLELFTERARSLEIGFEPTQAVAELCARLDNLPLALELAAARTAIFTPEQLLQRLGERLDLLKSGRDGDPRQRTLRTTIEWSHNLLDAGEQRLFARLSVFAGGCSYEAAEAVCEADPDTVQSLHDKSLLRRRDGDFGPRFWMLETIRQYASEQLAGSSEDDEIRYRRAQYFADRAAVAEEGLLGSAQEEWLQRLDVDRDNLLLTLAELDARNDLPGILRLARCSVYFAVKGLEWHLFEPLRRCISSGTGDPKDRIRAARVTAIIARNRGDLEFAEELARASVDLARSFGDADDLVRALETAAGVEIMRGHVEAAQAHADECLRHARSSSNPVRTSRALGAVANLALYSGDWDASIAASEEGLRLRPDIPADHIGLHLINLALALALRGDTQNALDVSEESLQLHARTADGTGVAYVLETIAGLAGRRSPTLAAELLAASSELQVLFGFTLEPFEQSFREQTCAAIADALGHCDLKRLGLTAVSDIDGAADLGQRAIEELRNSEL